MKLAVIGGGPGGYVAAIRAAQLGAEVTVIEKDTLGGTCLNVGCIPTKVLLHSSELLQQIKAGADIGIKVEGKVTVDWESIQNRKKAVVNKLVFGVKGLLAANKVKVIKGTATFESNNTLSVEKKDGSVEKINFDTAIIASGSVPFIPPIIGSKLPGVIDSTGALNLENNPKSLVVIGGGVIGVEFASIFNPLGCKVSIIEMLPYILPPVDREIAELTRKELISKGVDIYNNSKVTAIEKSNNGLKVLFTNDKGDFSIESEKVLVAVGRRSNIVDLEVEKIGIRTERGCILVDDKMETNIKGIYAIGDCTGKNMLAHVASDQGIVAVENIMGENKKMDYKTVPSCVYTKPEIASVGLTEEEAKKKGIDYKIGKFPLAANGKSLIMGETSGVIKFITDKKYDEVLGVHIYGPRATDLITEAALALRLEATVEEIVTTVHAHPTVGEAMKEAALAVNKGAIHMVNK
ncbi:dihydrolipoyl dehydrogenase [Clostridium pasteurianum DSM 525 = ATCC 6013]|uniref:Dihydrolipoyl dehydrogenase n=1 Tax=Clostridium pasteurianum DSM 525 = ATCC 6013 TaxID=1262449 RepID=A0A0H3J807_CLOPA|nr:dihydrolipoyl dehydrogenase [Clostridium pasteurianum]AJA48038.1 dihydrolipoyl dehydrogenase [Clostridium pasteurianum DSM 525 = ATCC 6013]AJA52026.1 dihydrolipoyl dehydrogenase [Clostridium pasteurianum DSM 525 = ATCC 6013]AOZ75320.1 dihydrolipoamide dehydrogenase [Clostridium pasteurianum DSM 525 = ATCC 6013]AOZ79115.1 dihydrolipoamide dehydrogenase [Clostridium pasteurianum]ELP59940.1 TPP-dependent acetoin dehydrogenase complex, E3 component, dihydrolipoamide dehydrogenase [Clostridium p